MAKLSIIIDQQAFFENGKYNSHLLYVFERILQKPNMDLSITLRLPRIENFPNYVERFLDNNRGKNPFSITFLAMLRTLQRYFENKVNLKLVDGNGIEYSPSELDKQVESVVKTISSLAKRFPKVKKLPKGLVTFKQQSMASDTDRSVTLPADEVVKSYFAMQSQKENILRNLMGNISSRDISFEESQFYQLCTSFLELMDGLEAKQKIEQDLVLFANSQNSVFVPPLYLAGEHDPIHLYCRYVAAAGLILKYGNSSSKVTDIIDALAELYRFKMVPHPKLSQAEALYFKALQLWDDLLRTTLSLDDKYLLLQKLKQNRNNIEELTSITNELKEKIACFPKTKENITASEVMGELINTLSTSVSASSLLKLPLHLTAEDNVIEMQEMSDLRTLMPPSISLSQKSDKQIYIQLKGSGSTTEESKKEVFLFDKNNSQASAEALARRLNLDWSTRKSLGISSGLFVGSNVMVALGTTDDNKSRAEAFIILAALGLFSTLIAAVYLLTQRKYIIPKRQIEGSKSVAKALESHDESGDSPRISNR